MRCTVPCRWAAWPGPTPAAVSRTSSRRWPPSCAPRTVNTRESEGTVPVNLALGHVSNDFLIAALVFYSLSVVAFAGDFAFGRPLRADTAARAQEARERTAALAAVGAAGGEVPRDAAGGEVPQDGAAGPGSGAAAAPDSMPEVTRPALRAIGEAGRWIQAAMALAVIAVGAHLIAVVTRGLAVHRPPWGNMYEFVTALTCVAAIFFVYVMVRYRAWTLGVFVIGAVVVALGLAETVIYTAAGPLVPALQSYWLSIHVTAITLAVGTYFVAAVLGIVYLLADRHARRVAAGRVSASDGVM